MINNLFDNPLFNITFFGGLLFILTGLITYLFPPKKINFLYGYRTNRSMKSQESWDFAQKFSAKELMKLGFVLTALSFIPQYIHFNNSVNLILGISLLILVVIILFVRVELAIKAKF